MTFVEIIGDINTTLYGVAAGLAILMIAIHGIRWKLAETSQGREDAKRGILNVILGLAVIITAASLVYWLL